jgi:hypothetical protein
MAIRFPRWITTVATMSSSGARMPPFPTANAVSPGKSLGAVSPQMAWLAIAVAVTDDTRNSALREVLLAAFPQVIHYTKGLQITRVSLMNRAPCPWVGATTETTGHRA